MSGPLARFGKAGANALAIWAERSAVALEVIDAYPSAGSAIGAAEASRPDVVFGPYGSGPALAAAAASKGVEPPVATRGNRSVRAVNRDLKGCADGAHPDVGKPTQPAD